MTLPPLQLPVSSGFYVSGNVTIAADAVIAPGVVLQADPGAVIVIGAGACVGLGAVIHAHGGTIAVEPGANLGAGVLIVGQCRVGTGACLGASTTVYNSVVAPGQLVAPGSLLGANSSTVSSMGQQGAPAFSQSPSPSPWDDEVLENSATASLNGASNGNSPNQSFPVSQSEAKATKVVYGKEQFYQIRTMMFPNGEPNGRSDTPPNS